MEKKIKLDVSDPEVKETYESALEARSEVAAWPAWKRGERAVPRPNPCAWCGLDRNADTKPADELPCSCPHALGTFVFGSNIAGIHGAGAAAHAAKEYDAEWGVGFGPTGRSYAIPTKDENIETMPLDMIAPFVREFIEYAEKNPLIVFLVTRIGCGLAGYTDEEIAPLFFWHHDGEEEPSVPSNCIMPIEWREKWPDAFGKNRP